MALLQCFGIPQKRIVRRRPEPSINDLGGSSASTISADVAATGSHELTITGYSDIKGLGVGKVINSAPFRIGGHSWKVEFYPDGDIETSKDCICIFLKLIEDPKASKGYARAHFKFSLLDEDGKPWFDRTSSTLTFSRGPSASWGYRDFIARKTLESSPHVLKDDSFRIRCDVTVVKIRAQTIAVQLVAAPSPDLARDLAALLESKLGADVKFKVGGDTFLAHRYVLAARSPIFEAELFGQMKEKKASKIRIADMEAKVFEAMLYFVYTDSLPKIDDGEERFMAQHLLVAGDRYGLQRLKLVSEETLCKFVDISTTATTLVLAEQHGCDQLKEACLKFLKLPGNMKAVMATDGYQHLKESCPSLSDELLQKVAP